MIGVSIALILVPYDEGRSDARSHRQRRPDGIPQAFAGQRLRIVRRTLLVVGCLICLASLGRALSPRLSAAAASLVPFTPPCRVLGTWVTSTPTLSARPGCLAAWQ
jgi:hypothetical protein